MAEPMKRCSIIVADDHPVVLNGVRSLVASASDFEVVAAHSDGAAALEAIRALSPDLALLDVSMPKKTGTEVLSAVAEEGLATRIVLLTASATDEQIRAAVALGVWGLLMKDAAADMLLDCLRVVASGRRWLFGAEVLAALEREAARAQSAGRLSVLTPRERQLVELVAEGLPNKLIARELGLTEGTVKIHLHNVYQKLGVNNRTTLAALAFRHGDSRK
ncbi:response regulator transcription factor [Phenylobacterium sp.]|uniref:response regulator transcription factor n=1 Tax=Phenylobacterium sp. TaxID=1871053 RepID=UPI00281144AF|nr:response regulator transcription factor [Phenylobacterium sp.]